VLRNFVDFACFVSMYPQLVAGPIIRFSEVDDQLRNRTHSPALFARGVAFFTIGLAKKVILANPCGRAADAIYAAGSADVVDAWYGLFAYALQGYFDFSGCSDMAIGLGLMLGFVFPKNFDSPYLARSITEFWRRWHISLSTWLRDYLYVPLGGNQRGQARTYVNLVLVMLLGGLWHGANWTFVVWGGIHGAWLVFERVQGKRSLYRSLPDALRIGITFLIVLIAWVFFRAESVSRAVSFLGCMFGLVPLQPGAYLLRATIYAPYYLGSFVLAGLIVWGMPQAWDWTRNLTWPKAVGSLALLVLSVVVLEAQAYNPFIYFIF